VMVMAMGGWVGLEEGGGGTAITHRHSRLQAHQYY
jgi:hypothetical protein